MDAPRIHKPINQETRLFWLIMAAALIPRMVAAFSYSVNHADELYQYLEPAHRMLFGYGTVTWEYRDGIRSWLPAWLFVAPMGLGHILSPTSNLTIYLPRLMMAFLSLVLVWSAWRLGRRQSLFDAVMAASIAALWAEFISFAPHTLTEQLATLAIIPALVLATEDKPRFKTMILVGFLLGLGAVFRPHYVPAIAVGLLMIMDY